VISSSIALSRPRAENIYPHHDLSYGLRVPRNSWNGFQTRFHLGTGIIALIANAVHRRSGGGAGNTFPGLSRPWASKAHFSRCCWFRSISENISPIGSRFSMPTSCSPVSAPPRSTAAAQDVGAERLCLLDLAGLVGVMEDQPVQIAVAGMEDDGNARLSVGWRILVRPKARWL
jgi:hypothetical protein